MMAIALPVEMNIGGVNAATIKGLFSNALNLKLTHE
ncbi:hypothetical protein Lepto7376_1069 [[Leptolyngbya] sp. PCC 7376]|nr:hypothetical protein Lepto7376_1069 [[Leptolyngbya] sp. PCC 7376]